MKVLGQVSIAGLRQMPFTCRFIRKERWRAMPCPHRQRLGQHLAAEGLRQGTGRQPIDRHAQQALQFLLDGGLIHQGRTVGLDHMANPGTVQSQRFGRFHAFLAMHGHRRADAASSASTPGRRVKAPCNRLGTSATFNRKSSISESHS